jgi:hypothetical protein
MGASSQGDEDAVISVDEAREPDIPVASLARHRISLALR